MDKADKYLIFALLFLVLSKLEFGFLGSIAWVLGFWALTISLVESIKSNLWDIF